MRAALLSSVQFLLFTYFFERIGNPFSLRERKRITYALGIGIEKPRAMFEVRGEVLIERLIRQLKEAGIDDITVVVGYMKEAFFYLEDSFGVSIVVNDEYATRNNNYSLWCA